MGAGGLGAKRRANTHDTNPVNPPEMITRAPTLVSKPCARRRPFARATLKARTRSTPDVRNRDVYRSPKGEPPPQQRIQAKLHATRQVSDVGTLALLEGTMVLIYRHTWA